MRTKTELFSSLAFWPDPVARDGPEQMACDEALLAAAKGPVLRVFRWSRPWVSAGYFVSMEEAAAVRPDLPVCRRWTGGGVVVHEQDLTYGMAVPRTEELASLRPQESYRAIHSALASALGRCGLKTVLAEAGGPALQECFAGPVENDVVSGGLKIAGGAQRRTKAGLLHQGSVQLEDAAQSDLAAAFAAALARRVISWEPPDGFEDAVRDLTGKKYASPRFLQGR